jgi:hypothetical protein
MNVGFTILFWLRKNKRGHGSKLVDTLVVADIKMNDKPINKFECTNQQGNKVGCNRVDFADACAQIDGACPESSPASPPTYEMKSAWVCWNIF